METKEELGQLRSWSVVGEFFGDERESERILPVVQQTQNVLSSLGRCSYAKDGDWFTICISQDDDDDDDD